MGEKQGALENLVGHSFLIKGKIGRRRKDLCFSFIINSSSRLSREFSLSLGGQAGPQMIVFYVREHLGIINLLELTGQDETHAAIVLFLWGMSCATIAWICC